MKNRIKGHEVVDIALIDPSPWGNPRTMSRRAKAALASGMREIGFVSPLTVRKVRGEEGWRFQVVNGHHRLDELKASGAEQADVVVVSLTDEEARLVAITLNSIGAGWNLEELDAYTRSLVESTGFDVSAVARLTAFTPLEAKILGAIPTSVPDTSQRTVPPIDGVRVREERLAMTFWFTTPQRETVENALTKVRDSEDVEMPTALGMVARDYCERRGLEPMITPGDGRESPDYTPVRLTKVALRERRARHAGVSTARKAAAGRS